MLRIVTKFALLLFAAVAVAQGPSVIAPQNGGTGQNSGAWSGCAWISSGLWSALTCPTVLGASDVTNQSTSQSTVNLVASTPATARYRIGYYANENALCTSGTVSVSIIFSWFDPVAHRTVQSLPLTITTTQSTTAGSVQGIVPIFAQASTAITYTSTVAGSCTTGGPASYDVHVVVEEM